MAHIITHNIASLPLYQDGFAVGRDTGLRLALDQLTAERIRQERLATKRRAGSQVASRHTFAAGILLDVTKTVARRFRQ
jgi:hypothetical protein